MRVTNYFADFDTNDSDNENSIITLIESYGKKILLTGDAGVLALSKLSNVLPSNIDVLKVPHHGAEAVLNKDLMKKLAPKVAVISVGKNVYGHPSKSTLDLLKDTTLLRTDVNNAIKVVISSKSLVLMNYDMNKKQFVKSF